MTEAATKVKQPKCIIGEPCLRHGFIHGAEANELREELERYERYDVEKNWARRILDKVDARDSVAWIEMKARLDGETD
jgi:hypothetical protein